MKEFTNKMLQRFLKYVTFDTESIDDNTTVPTSEGQFVFARYLENELREINRIAGEMGVKAPVAVRVNPHVDAHTHKYVTTGLYDAHFLVQTVLVDLSLQNVDDLLASGRSTSGTAADQYM